METLTTVIDSVEASGRVSVPYPSSGRLSIIGTVSIVPDIPSASVS